MASIARPPCDEGAILAGSCQCPVTAGGPWILAATILGSSMVFIDGTVVNVALPALQSALHATLADVQWVVESGPSLANVFTSATLRRAFVPTMLIEDSALFCCFNHVTISDQKAVS